MTQLLGLLLGPVVLAAYPDCNFLVDYCVYHIGDDNAFGNAWFDGNRPQSKRNDVCNASRWQEFDDCIENCPLEFVVTEPAELRMKLCMQDTYFKPFKADNHLDLSHPLNGVEMEVVSAGGGYPARYACTDTDLSDRNYTDKIVLAKHGSCSSAQKIAAVGRAGANVGLLVSGGDRDYLPSQLSGLEGSSHDISILGFSVVQAGTDFIIEYLDNGGVVKGKVQLTCGERDPDRRLWDGCSYAGSLTSQYGGCSDMPEEENRLCTRCPVEATVGGKTICLRGNTLLPRQEVNHMWASPQFSLPFEEANMVYLETSSGGGCWESDYDGHSGKVVLIPPPTGCLYHHAVVMAQRAGVKAFILVTPQAWRTAISVTGTSAVVNISVHSLDPSSFTDFISVAQTMPLASGAYVFDVAASYAEGEAPPYDPPPTPEPVVEVVVEVRLEEKEFEFTGVVIGMLVFSVVVLVLITMKMLLRAKVEHAGELKGFNLPLGAASALLSLTLLSIVATIAFILAYTNGQDSTDTAIEDGNTAINSSFVNSEEVVSELNHRWRQAMVDSVYEATVDFFTEGWNLGRTCQSIMYAYDGTWAGFESLFPTYYVLSLYNDWEIMFRTVEGFHISSYSVTDSRSNSTRGDGLAHVSVTNDGLLYGYEWYWFSSSSMSKVGYWVFPKGTLDAFNTIGEYFGRWQDFFVGYTRDDSPSAWTFSTYSFVGLASYQGDAGQGAEWRYTHPLTYLLPVYDSNADLTGNVQLTKSVILLDNAIGELVRSFDKAENVTVFAVRDDGVLLSAPHGTTRRIDQFTRMYGMVYSAKESITLDNTYCQELLSLGHHLKHVNNGTLVTSSGEGEFEQSEWYQDVSGWRVFDFGFESGATVDETGNNYKAEAREGAACNGREACVVDDEDPARGKVLALDGSNVFYVYNNLTVDTPRVAGTRVEGGGGPWNSSFELYNTTRVEPDGSELVVSYDHGTGLWNPVLREPFVVQTATIAMWVKPEVPVSDSPVPGRTSPRLFADTEQGDARWLWYANGMFFLGIENYGCMTEVIPGGPPVGAWTHLSASIDQLVERVCRVYVNGTLHSEVPVSQYTSVPWPFYEPYRVGQHFQGRIDGVQVFNNSLNNAEALQLYQTGEYVKHITQKEWVYNYRSFYTGGTVGMRFAVGVLIPKEDVLRSVREGNLATQDKLGVQQANTQTKLDQKMGESLFVVVPIVLLCALAFLVFNDVLTAPFAEMAWLMNEASLMRVSQVAESSSLVTEINVMYKAMHSMVRNLNEFRNFMPASVLLQAHGDSDTNDETSTVLSGAKSVSGSVTGSMSTKSMKINNRDVIDKMSLSVSKRRAACVMVNVVGWHAHTKEMDPAQVVELYQGVVTLVSDVIHAFKGVCESFSGDRFFGGFNTVRPISGYRLAVCEAALELKKQWNMPTPPSMAVVYGDGLVGNIGAQHMKKYTFLSVVVPWGYALERYAKAHGLCVVTDDFMADTIGDSIYSRAVGMVGYAKRISRAVAVYELGHKLVLENSEWMYQLDSIARADHWNEFCKALFTKEYDKARRARNLVKDVPEHLDPVLVQLTAALDAKNFHPTELTYC